MRILVITEYLPASERGEITGGVEAFAYYVGRHLRADHDVQFIARPTDGSVWDDASLRSIPGRLAFLTRALWSGLRADADVVVAMTYVVHPIAWLIGKVRRRPVVFYYPDVLIGRWRSQFGPVVGTIGEVTERLLLRLRINHFIANSETTAGKLVAHGVAPARVTAVPCGYEPAMVADVVPEPASGRRIAVVSRLVPYKRVDVVVRALAQLAKQFDDVRVVVVGQGPELDSLRALATRLGVADRVEFRGFVDRHADVLATVAGSDAFVSASEVEGFGIVVVEAMALGVPYVVSDIPAFREVTAGGVGGTLFRTGDEVDLAAGLAAVLSDPNTRAEQAAAGRAHAERYTWGAIAEQTERVLAGVVGVGT